MLARVRAQLGHLSEAYRLVNRPDQYASTVPMLLQAAIAHGHGRQLSGLAPKLYANGYWTKDVSTAASVAAVEGEIALALQLASLTRSTDERALALARVSALLPEDALSTPAMLPWLERLRGPSEPVPNRPVSSPAPPL